MSSNLEDNKKVYTAPDIDYSRCFKLMLIDFEWDQISEILSTIRSLSMPSTVYLYGSKDNSPQWCLDCSRQSNSVLINMNHRGNCELLKGFLLGENNVFTFGKHQLSDCFPRSVMDPHAWVSAQSSAYLTEQAYES